MFYLSSSFNIKGIKLASGSMADNSKSGNLEIDLSKQKGENKRLRVKS